MRNLRFSLPDTVRQPVKAAFATASTFKPNNHRGCSAVTASTISLSPALAITNGSSTLTAMKTATSRDGISALPNESMG